MDQLVAAQKMRSAKPKKPEDPGAPKSSGQCGWLAYDYCCGVGTPCDCSKGTLAPGQCEPESYVYCCEVGQKCDCSRPP